MAYWDTAGRSDEWYTPKHVFEALGCRFDLDVASPANCTTFVPAETFLTERGLEADWHGFVWMNAPFGGRNCLAPWLSKFFEHGNGIALTLDRTSAPWFRDAWSRAERVLFTPKLRFIRPDGSEGKSPSNGTALLAVGEIGCAALGRAARKSLGILGAPIPMRCSVARSEVFADGVREGFSAERVNRAGELAVSQFEFPLTTPSLSFLGH